MLDDYQKVVCHLAMTGDSPSANAMGLYAQLRSGARTGLLSQPPMPSDEELRADLAAEPDMGPADHPNAESA